MYNGKTLRQQPGVFPRDAITKYHKFGGLKTIISCLTVLEARSSKSWYWQDHGASETYREDSFLVFS